MILENFKKIRFAPASLLRVLMVLVFVSAALFRLINPEAGGAEMVALNLPAWLTWPLAVFELIAGLALLLAGKYSRKASWLLIVFLSLALIWALFLAGVSLLASSRELFIFNLSPTDFFLHLVFIIILLSLTKRPV